MYTTEAALGSWMPCIDVCCDDVVAGKGYTNWAIGMTVASLTEAVLRNEHRVLALSVPIKGRFGIEDDVYLSVPAVLGSEGVTETLNVKLADDEIAKLHKSAAAIAKVQKELDFGDVAASATTATGASK